MARTPKYGLCYASIFSGLLSDDRRIDKLISSQGWHGVGVFMYLTLQAYGDYGYFTEWCFADCATTARKMGGGISAKQVEEAICCCVQAGLFDKGLLDTWGILTNTDIQEAYLVVAKARRLKVFWKPEYWLLAEKPPAGSLVPCGQNENNHSDNANVKVIGKSNTSTTTTTSSKLESGARENQSSLSLSVLSDEEIEERQKKYGDAIDHWDKILARLLTPFELGDICALVDEYGGHWVVDAMSVAGRASRPKLNYVQGTLNRWKTDGRDAKKPAMSNSGAAESEEAIRASFMLGTEGGT